MANEAPNLAALSTSFLELGPKIFRKNINALNLSDQGILVYKNVKTPQALPKTSVSGGPRPYRAQDDTADTFTVADRILTVNQSKWDFDIDTEKFRNTYLAKYKPGAPSFAEWIIAEVSAAYLSAINNSTIYLGAYNASGTTAAALATGWGTTIAAEITATTLTPVTTTAITTGATAMAAVQAMASAAPAWMREKGYRIFCSYTVFDFYAQQYAATFGYQFNADATNRYRINNQNAYLQPVSWMGTSGRLIATIDDNLVLGTDGDSIQVATSVRRNIIESRLMMPIGLQIADLDALLVSTQA